MIIVNESEILTLVLYNEPRPLCVWRDVACDRSELFRGSLCFFHEFYKSAVLVASVK
jgi:hypothetical protein